MKSLKLLLAVVVVGFLATDALSYEYSKKNSYELSVFIHNLLVSVKPECESVAEIENLPCKWERHNVNFRQTDWEMDGKAYITVYGEFPKNHENGTEELPWDVIIKGSLNRIKNITLSPDGLAFGKKGSGADFQLSPALDAIPGIKYSKRVMPRKGGYFSIGEAQVYRCHHPYG